jgi:hypothetical protein
MRGRVCLLLVGCALAAAAMSACDYAYEVTIWNRRNIPVQVTLWGGPMTHDLNACSVELVPFVGGLGLARVAVRVRTEFGVTLMTTELQTRANAAGVGVAVLEIIPEQGTECPESPLPGVLLSFRNRTNESFELGWQGEPLGPLAPQDTATFELSDEDWRSLDWSRLHVWDDSGQDIWAEGVTFGGLAHDIRLGETPHLTVTLRLAPMQ